jgi:hypothetical protein
MKMLTWHEFRELARAYGLVDLYASLTVRRLQQALENRPGCDSSHDGFD